MLNADGAVSTGTGLLGHNMFAYCNNNPVMMSDSDGTRPDAGGGTVRESASEVAQSTAAMYSKGQNQKYVNSVKASSSGKIANSAVQSISTRGEPNSHVTDYSDGYKKERWFGPDGRATKDRHHTDHKQPKYHTNPHDHDWDWSDPEHPIPCPSYPSPEEFTINWDPVIGTGIACAALVGMVAIASDDVTGVGIADDAAEVPLFATFIKGLTIAFY